MTLAKQLSAPSMNEVTKDWAEGPTPRQVQWELHFRKPECYSECGAGLVTCKGLEELRR